MSESKTNMKTFRYDTSGRWLKGNIHLHSTASDGGKTFAELAELYASAGYDFLFRTDHWVASRTSRDTGRPPLLWLDGIELDGQDHTGAGFHVVCLGALKGLSQKAGFEAALESARQQGALLLLAHPHWTGNSLADSRRWRFAGVEIYNHLCHWMNGKGGGLVHWDAMLRDNPDTLAFAVDDAHLSPAHPGWNGGWIRVNVPARGCPSVSRSVSRRTGGSAVSPTKILSAIRRGNYYSTCGPDFHSIRFDGTQVHLRTSPVRFVRLVGPGYLGKRLGSFDGPLLTDATLPVEPDWAYMYAEIEAPDGKRAWTNTLFCKARYSTGGTRVR